MTRPGYAVVYVVILCTLAKGSSEGTRWNQLEFLNDWGSFSSSFQVDGKKVEQAWKHCRKELIERNNGVEDFDFHPVEGSSELRCSRLIKENIQKATEFLPLQAKQNLLDCMKAKTSYSFVSEEKTSSRPLLTKYWTIGRGRNLLAKPDDNTPPTTASSPSPSDSLSPSPSPSPSPSSSPSPVPEPETEPDPTEASPSKDKKSDKKPDNKPDKKADKKPTSSASPQLPSSNPLVDAPPLPDKHEKYEGPNIILIAVVPVCGILAFIVICFCFCKRRSNKVDSKESQIYDSPLLTEDSADVLATSTSQKFVGLENSDQKESSTTTSVSNLPEKPEDSSVAETIPSTGQIPAPPLQPPPAEPAPPPPGPPPPPAPHAPPPPRAKAPPAPPKPMHGKNKSSEQAIPSEGGESGAPKPKLKPFFWDKVNAKGDQGKVWQQINAGSFQFNEEMIESLFGCANPNKNDHKKGTSLEPAVQYIQVIDPRKAQNLSILLRALNVTTQEVVDALNEGNEIPTEIIHALLRMAPTADEELKLRLFTGDINHLGPAERFLKVLVEIPFAFKRLESLMFINTLSEEFSSLKDSFGTLEVASNKLRKSRLFLKLLEAVLKTGNRMNDGTYRGGAQAFKLDTLLKLSDVKGTDGKTTLLHFVVQEIIRSEGIRAVRTQKDSQPSMSSVKTDDFVDDGNQESLAEHYRSLGLQVVSGLSQELGDVKNAAVLDGEGLTASVAKLGHSLMKCKEFLNDEMKNLDEDSEFHHSLKTFVEKAEGDVTWLLEEEKRIMALVKSTADYFHGQAGKDEGLRLFVVVRDFLIMLDKACKEVQATTIKSGKVAKKESPSVSSSQDSPSLSSSQETPTVPSPQETPQSIEANMHRLLFPAIAGRRVEFSDSDDESECSSPKSS